MKTKLLNLLAIVGMIGASLFGFIEPADAMLAVAIGATTNFDEADLKAALAGGWVHEDLMRQIFDISKIPLPFADLMGTDPVANSFTEWPKDVLAAVDITNAAVDGADLTGDDSVAGTRVGNHSQTMTKVVRVSSRARTVDTVGGEQLSYQVMRRQQELLRDRDAIMSGQQASVADDGDSIPGKLGAFGAWLTSHTFRGATGADGGFNTTTKIVDAPTLGTVRALTETLIRDAAQSVYEAGGNPTVLMSTPGVIRGLSEYLFTSSARIATLQSSQEDKGTAALTAQGSVNVFVTDFGVVMTMDSNRLMPDVGTDNANLYLIDPEFIRMGEIFGPRVEPLAKTGLADNRSMATDVTLKVLAEEAHAVVADIDDSLAVIA